MKRLKDFLGSSKLALVLFFLLALISIIGTFLPQAQPSEFYLHKYGQFLGKFILTLKLDDAYHSFWYIFCLFLFIINLIFCSLNRFPLVYKLFQKDSYLDPEKIPFKKIFMMNKSPEIIENRLIENRFKKIAPNFFIKEKYRWSFFSFMVVHFSLIIIFLGALLGAIFGFIGNISLIEGASSNIVQPFRKKDLHFLPFSLKLNRFILETYPNGMPKEYISYTTIYDGGKIFNATIKVNAPLKYKGYKFYQANYQIIPEFKIVASYNGRSEELILSSFAPVVFQNRFHIGVIRFAEAHGYLFVNIWVFDEEKNRQAKGILIKGVPHFQLPVENNQYLKIDLKDIHKTYFMSGLQVKKDPATPIVYIGFILIMVAFVCVYYFEPQRIWIYLDPKNSQLYIGAYKKRNRSEIPILIEKVHHTIVK